MTGESANRLTASTRSDAITVHGTVRHPRLLLSLTKPAMIAVIVPNCLMAGKWMIIVLERHEELLHTAQILRRSPRPMSLPTCT